ncbi:MAG: tetratricopeptide repeat protein [Bacteroidales bacterium]|nr:tetratricopeptide repeat protein [Bacteroidales bacterium]
MRKLALFLFTVGLSVLAFSQTRERVNAYDYLKDGDLDLAKKSIDKCVVHPTTEKDPRAWLYYGQIYHSIAISQDPNYKNLDPQAESKAYEGYKKAILYNFKDESYHNLDIDNNQMDMITFSKALMNKETKYTDEQIVMDIIINRYPALANALVNKGLTLFQDEKKYDEALNLFEKSLFTSSMVGKVDTQAVYFCALAASKANKTDDAIQYYTALAQMEYGENDLDKAKNYYFLAQQYKAKNETEKYLENINKGIEKYPNASAPLLVEMINYYLSNGQQKEALEYLDKGIETTPDNASLYFAKGTIYDTDSLLGDKEKAKEAYIKTIALDSTHFDAYYNLGAIYFNQGAAKNEEANNVDPDNYKKYKAVKAEADGFFKQALPYLEKAHELNSEDMSTMQSLKLIYYRLGDLEKHDALKAKMEGK